MKKNYFKFLTAIFLVVFLFQSNTVSASENKAVDVCVSHDNSVLMDRILKKALENLGYKVNISSLKMKSAIIAVDEGFYDVLASQPEGLEEKYTNLTIVPEEIGKVYYRVYGKEDTKIELNDWGSLAGYRIGIEFQRNYVTEKLKQNGKIHYDRFKGRSQLMDAIASGQIDFAIVPSYFDEKLYCDPGIKALGDVEVKPAYIYVNKAFSDLVPKLSKELRRMKFQGQLAELQKEWTPGADGKKKILHIMSYNEEIQSEGDLSIGMREALAEYQDTQLSSISLNSNLKENHDARCEMYGDILRSDFVSRPPDVIIVSDNYALDFMKDYYFRLFSGIPIIYVGVEGTEFADFGENLHFVKKTISAVETIELGLKLFPKTREVFVANDTLKDGRAWENLIREQLKVFGDRVKITYSGGMTLEEVLKTINNLPADAIVFSGNYYGGNSERYYTGKEIQELLDKNYTTPVFSCNLTGFGEGELGGKYIDKVAIGNYVAEMAVSIINGKAVTQAMIDQSVIPNKWSFDVMQMKKWKVHERSLPKDTVFINQESSLRTSNPVAYLLILAFGIICLCIIFILSGFVVAIRRKNYTLVSMQNELVEAEILIAKEKEVQDAYRKTQRNLKLMVDSIPWPMCIVDSEDISIYYANEAYKKHFRLLEEMVQFPVWRLFPEYQPNGEASVIHVKNFVKKICQNKSHEEDEITHISPTGEQMVMKVIGTEITYNGRRAISIVLQDVSSQKKIESRLRASAIQEKEANQLKNKFIINMSHEIRTPMNAIIGLSDIELLKVHPQEVMEPFEKINASAKMLLTIVNDILDFSKMEADKLSIEEEEFTLEEAISGALITSSQRLIDKKVEMLLRMDRNIPKTVFGDKTRLWQIVKNVLDNSAKFTDEGRIVLSIQGQEISPEKKMLSFIFEDTGRGMDENSLEKLFAPFEQFGESGTKTQGTGLGMSITKQLVELMGGSIEVESVLGKGTRTFIQIPFKFKREDHTIGTEWMNGCLKGKKILVVDDDFTATDIMQELLGIAGASTVILNEAEQVIPCIQEQNEINSPFDLILMDYMLDKGTGLEIARELEKKNIRHAKILMVSAYARLKYDYVMKEKLFIDVIDKPFVTSEFYNKIANAMSGKSSVKKKKTKKLQFTNAKVLVCEDNIINQDVIKGILNLFGVEPVIANHGQEGINCLEKERFDLVIMDMLMPVMDGHTATVRIRESGKSYQDVPIVAMTANAMKEEKERCIREGMNGYISKPIDLEGIYVELLKWLPSGERKEEKEVTEGIKVTETIESIRKKSNGDEHREILQVGQTGIEVDEAIRRFGGNFSIYRKTLRRFAGETMENGMPDYNEMMEETKREEFRRYIHSMKGVTGNLSINQVNKMLQEFEKGLKAEEADKALYKKLKAQLMKTAADVLNILETDQKTGEVAGSENELQKLLGRLQDYLMNGKANESEKLAEELRKKKWAGVSQEETDAICEAVEGYDYQKAIDLIKR